MIKLTKIIVLSLVFSSVLAVKNSHAMFVKTDYLKSASKVFTTVSDIFRDVQTRVEESGAKKTIKSIGEGYTAYKGDFDKMRARVEAEQQGLAEASGMNRLETMTGDQIYEQEKAKLAAKAKAVAEVEELKEQKASIEAQFISDSSTLRSEAGAAQKNLDNNSKIYSTMLAEEGLTNEQKEEYSNIISANDKSKSDIQLQLAQNIAKIADIRNGQVDEIDTKIKSYKDELIELGYNAGKDIADKIFKKQKAKTAEMAEEAANKLYLSEDENASMKNIDALIVSRNKDAFNNTVNANTYALKLKMRTGPNNDMAQYIQDSTAMLDGSNDSLSQDTMAKIEQMKILIDLIRLKTLHLKAETSVEISKMNIYQRSDYDSNQGIIDLCGYKPSEEQKAAALKRAKEFFGVESNDKN